MEQIKIEIGAKRTRVVVYEDVDYAIPKEENIKQPKIPTNQEKEEKEKKQSQYKEFNYYNRLKKRRDAVKELIYNNFAVPHVSLVTLTFDNNKRGDKNFSDLDQVHREFKNFILRMNRAYNNFKYVAVFNRQENGNWHYHMFCNLDKKTSNTEIAEIWKLGYVWIEYIESNSELYDKVSYCIRNMQEIGLTELQGEKGYLCSKNLNRNIVLRTWKESEEQMCDKIFQELKDKPKKLLYTAERVQGIKAETLDKETGEILTYYDNQVQLDEMLASNGYEEWVSKFHHISSSKKYPELFKMLPTAEKRKGNSKSKH